MDSNKEIVFDSLGKCVKFFSDKGLPVSQVTLVKHLDTNRPPGTTCVSHITEVLPLLPQVCEGRRVINIIKISYRYEVNINFITICLDS